LKFEIQDLRFEISDIRFEISNLRLKNGAWKRLISSLVTLAAAPNAEFLIFGQHGQENAARSRKEKERPFRAAPLDVELKGST
jgi:hypothetical protein